MRNSLSMDTYRLLKTKCTYILYICYIALMVMVIYAMKILYKTDASSVETTVKDFVVMLLQGNNIIFFLVIFIAMFINAEFNSGYIKNIMGDLNRKSDYVISKVIIFAICTAVYVITGVLLAILGSYIVAGELDFTGFGKAMVYAGVIYLLNLSFAIIMTFVTILVRNSAASTSIGIIYNTTIAGILYSLINYGVSKLFDNSDFMIQKYAVEGNMLILTAASKSTELLRGVVVAIIFGAIAIFGSIQIVRKRDV